MFQKYKLLIPTLVLVMLVTWTFINSGTNYILTVHHYFGLVAAIICSISFFVFRRYYKYVLGTTLILGLFNLFNFTPAQTTTSLNFNSLSVGFQPYSFLIIILTVILLIPKKSEVITIQSENVLKIVEVQFKEDLEKFKKLYSTLPSIELNEIIENKKYSEAAKEAARQILNEKGSV